MSDIYVSRFLRSVYMYDKTLSNRIDFDDDSECSMEEDPKEKKKMSKKGLIRSDCSVCEYYKICPECINFDDDSKCSFKAEQQKIKQEVKQDDYNTSTDY